MGSGPAVLVSDNFTRRFHLDLGGRVPIQTAQGIVSAPIVGIVEDYTSDRGIVIMGREQYAGIFNDSLVDSFDLYLRNPQDTERIRKRIQNLPESRLDLFVLTNNEMRTEIFRIIDETYKVLKVMEWIAVLVSILGIINTILASVLERTRMLGVLRALGGTRRQISRMVVAEGIYLSAGGMVLGFFLGVILTRIIFSTVIPHSTGWAFPIQIPYLRLGIVAFIGLFLSGLAAYLPARHASRLNIVKAIEYE
jgi:putative ABC transport system permease protein